MFAAQQIIVRPEGTPLLQQLLPAVVAGAAGLFGVLIGQRQQRLANRVSRNLEIYSRFLAQCHELVRLAHLVAEARPANLHQRHAELRDVVASLRAGASEIDLVADDAVASRARAVTTSAIQVSDGLRSHAAVANAIRESANILSNWPPLSAFESALAQLIASAKRGVD